jgi:PAS domain S-box-containing protein
LALLAVVGLAPCGARAGDASPWRNLADRVFRPIATNADLPRALIPETMAEDASGFLWLGGDAGLLRWDGYAFRDYPAQPKLPDGVRDAEIVTLHPDARGQLWAGTEVNGLARFDTTLGRLVCVRLLEAGCCTQHVWSIADDRQGGLWIATRNGLYRLDRSEKLVNQLHHDPARASSLPQDEVYSVLQDSHGVLWVGTDRGLARSSDSGQTFSAVPLDGGAPRVVSTLMEDSGGRIWVGTRHDGAYVIGADRGPARSIAATAPTSATDAAPQIMALQEIEPSRIWFATNGRGIVEVDPTTLKTQRITYDAFFPSGLNNDTVTSLYRDASGLIWIGTQAGLSQYDPGSAGLMTLFGHKGRRDGLGGGGVMSVLATADGKIWAGFRTNGFAVLDPSGRRASGLPGRRVFSLAPSPTGGVLLGTDAGLYLADPSGDHVVRLLVPDLGPKADISTLETVGDAVWMSVGEGPMWQLRIDANNHVSMVPHDIGARLTDPVIEVVKTAPDGRLAIGTDNGFNLFDPKSGAIERFMPDPANPHGLDAGLVGTIAADRLGRLWIGTSNGLDVFEGRDSTGHPVFRRLGMADGLPNNSVNGLLLDKRGFVWASTDMGLAEIDPDKFTVRAFQRADGLAITNYWTDSASATKDGDLVFGGIGGVTIVHPSAVKPWRYRPPVVITAARVGGAPVPVNQDGGTLLVVPAAANSLTVEFAALDFSAPDHNRYRYRLDGFDTTWTDTDAAHREAAYTNLPPGNYTLRLLGSNRDGLFTEPETTLPVKVLPAWYQTVWFDLAAGAAAFFAVLGVLRGWTAILRRRQTELQRQVADRTAELSVSKLQLQHANAVLEMRVAERTQALAERTAALEASEARFRAWFNNAEDAVFVVHVTQDGRFVFEAVNAAVERVFGIAASAYPGRRPEAVLPAEYAKAVLARYHEAAEGEPIQFETRFAAPGGERLLDTWIVPLRNPVTGRVERLVGASRDMTERRALEARLTQAQKLQALGGLAGGIAHDFNNILQAVAGAAMLMDQRPGDQEKVQRLARSTLAAAERGTSITKRLLAFARSDELRVEAMATMDVLEGLRDVLTYTLGSTIKVHTDFAENLPPLLADRGQLETALVNLGTNARDAMPNGGVLTLAARPEHVADNPNHPAGLAAGDYVRIDVTDTGTGMDATTLARAVEPFFTTKPQGKGTGLGLALVKGFTEQSGGGMAIESMEGAGTRVSLWLRQAGSDTAHTPVEAASGRAAAAATVQVLVVDDDDLVRETIAEQLEGAGFDVVAVPGGAEALDAIRTRGSPNAMVCDLSMPGMNGLDTIRQARDLAPGLPCFLLTGYAGERGALETGDSFTLLRKPISASALIAQIEAGLATERR